MEEKRAVSESHVHKALYCTEFLDFKGGGGTNQSISNGASCSFILIIWIVAVYFGT